MIKEIAFTVTPVTDIPRAREFYEGVLGLTPTMTAEEAGWIEYEIGQGAFAIARADEKWKPSALGSSVAFEVDDLETVVAKLKERQVPFDLEVTETPVCHLAVVLDPDGSKVLIHKRKGA
jgi:catechol 2,3-dioxygenase-like lactoylglutathione lyase family enzyme